LNIAASGPDSAVFFTATAPAPHQNAVPLVNQSTSGYQMTSTNDPLAPLFSSQTCATLLPPSRANEFFEALLGDAEEGAFDLALEYVGTQGSTLHFDILLTERPGHCLACNLTYGLPQVFTRHPVLDIEGLVKKVDAILGKQGGVGAWQLGSTSQRSRSLHVIPLTIDYQPAGTD